MVTPVTGKSFKSEELTISSPLQDYPTRNADFTEISKIVEPGPLYGRYEKVNGTDMWKYWQNDELIAGDVESKHQVARRYDKSDPTCKLRNILLTVLAKSEDAQLLI